MGVGDVRGRFSLFVVSYRRECQLPENFSEWKNVVSSQSYRIFKSRKYIQLHCALNFNRDFPKINLKNIFSYNFRDKYLKLGRYVLGTRTKLSEFWFRPQKWKYRILKIASAHFWKILGYRQFSKFDIFTSET